MKVMKIALLATAAVAAVSVSARAEDLGALKSQIEALNNRISQLEAAPSVPTGYQLLTISEAPAIVAPGMTLDKGYLPTATTLSIQPTADVPATTNVQWSGRVRAALVWDDQADANYSDVTIRTDTELKLTATTDTAVGEVGVFARWGASAVGHDMTGGYINRYYGWWKMTPEMSLVAGYMDTVGGIGHGNDSFTGHIVGGVGVVGGTDDASQFRLAYASGPISAAIALEGHDQDGILATGVDVDNDYGVSAEVKWAGDTVSGELAGFVLENGTQSDWQIGAGLTFGLDIITLSAAAGFGEANGASYMEGSVLAKANLSESVRVELGAGIENPDGDNNNTVGVNAGVYWAPVSQLTIGAEAAWKKFDDNDADVVAGLVTVFSF